VKKGEKGWREEIENGELRINNLKNFKNQYTNNKYTNNKLQYCIYFALSFALLAYFKGAL